jgi:tRNA (guanine-N7-)-methyltransferase
MLEDRDFFVTDNPETVMDPFRLFGSEKPLYIEIGSGKGEFISKYSLQHPEWNFLGFEGREKRIRNILKKVSPQIHTNVRLVCMMVGANLSTVLASRSVDGVFIQHPDPWPKKRHFKRRLFQQDFLNALAEVMIPGAEVHVSTDHEEYARWIANEFLRNPNFLSLQVNIIQPEPSLDDHVSTWYEIEQRRLGYAPNYMLFKRL